MLQKEHFAEIMKTTKLGGCKNWGTTKGPIQITFWETAIIFVNPVFGCLARLDSGEIDILFVFW